MSATFDDQIGRVGLEVPKVGRELVVRDLLSEGGEADEVAEADRAVERIDTLERRADRDVRSALTSIWRRSNTPKAWTALGNSAAACWFAAAISSSPNSISWLCLPTATANER